MDNRKKIFFVAVPLVVVVLLSLVLMAAPNFNSAELTVEEKALSIIADVIGIDLSRYNVELYKNYSEFYGCLFREHVDYALESDDGEMQGYDYIWESHFDSLGFGSE